MKIQTIRIISMLVAIIASAILLNPPFAAQSGAKTATLRVYTSDGFKPALQALIPKIEKAIGCNVAPSFESSKTLQQKIDSGESFDIAILSTNVIDDLVKSGKISVDTRASLGHAGI